MAGVISGSAAFGSVSIEHSEEGAWLGALLAAAWDFTRPAGKEYV